MEHLADLTLADFSARAIAYALQDKKTPPKDKLRRLTEVATSLPVLASEIAATSPATVDDVALPEQLYFNGVPIDPVTLSHAKLLELLQDELSVLRDIVTTNSAIHEEYAKDIIVAANITLEESRKSAVSLAVPTTEKPLKFVNLAKAYHNLTGQFTRISFIEGGVYCFPRIPSSRLLILPLSRSVEESDSDIDPPPVATFHLVTDLNSPAGIQLVKNALKFLVCPLSSS